MTLNARFPELEQDAAAEVALNTRLDDTYWGYVLRTEANPGIAILMMQAIAGAVGILFILAALAFWLLPGAILSGDVMVLKLVASGLCLVLGGILLRYASSGAQPELHIDQSRCEVRVVTRNGRGRTRMVGRYAFEDITNVRVRPDGEDEVMGLLLLELGSPEDVILAARAPEHQLSILRRRIARDLKQSKPMKPRRIFRQVSRLHKPATPGNKTVSADPGSDAFLEADIDWSKVMGD